MAKRERKVGERLIESLTSLRDVLARGEALGAHFKITRRKRADRKRRGK